MTYEELIAIERLNEFRLTDAEKQSVIQLFSFMEEETALLHQIDTENVCIMVHCMPMVNVFRDDERSQPFSREQLLKGSPEHTEDCWVVPRLVK